MAAEMAAGKPEPTIAQIALLLVWLLCLGSWFVLELALYKRRYGLICECCDSSGYDQLSGRDFFFLHISPLCCEEGRGSLIL
jgi:hypothetical protein